MSDLTPLPDGESQGTALGFDPSLSEDERRFYLKAYPTTDLVCERKVHCTICKMHIGTAPSQQSFIKMHPILRVTHCTKCHDFYNSGEFSKGEDGSELYCRWCGQGGEVYCCSNCPYVFCKSCIMKNLSRGVVSDIEQNENWSCFSCAPKILWPLRAQHWALINYIDKQKKKILNMKLPEAEEKLQMAKDLSTCCRLAKAKCGNMSDSLESLDSATSRRSITSGAGSVKKVHKLPVVPGQSPIAKRVKTNDEVVCTPDLLSMLEPDCQITMSHKPRPVQSPFASSPKVMSISGYGAVKNNTPPPLVLRNTAIQMRPIAPSPIVRRTVVGPRTPTPSGSNIPVYHTINGYRIDLNSAAQQDVFRLPNGKLIQVKRQGTQQQNAITPPNNWQQRPLPTMQQQQQSTRAVQITPTPPQPQYQAITIQHPATPPNNVAQQHPQMLRYHNTTVTPIGHNGTHIQVINSAPLAPVQSPANVRPLMVRHVFPDTAIGQARSQLQDQIFGAMDICQHLTGKIQTLTNSNAYKQARNYLEVKELYIHLSYLLTYAIGRYKGLQDKCLADMRQLGFVTDADSLENGQLAAGVDYVRYGQLNDVNLFNTGSNSFHNQIYEYRKSLLSNNDDDDECGRDKLPPLFSLGRKDDNDDTTDNWQQEEESLMEPIDDSAQEVDDYDEKCETYMDEEQQEEPDPDDDEYIPRRSAAVPEISSRRSTEGVMRREEESHAYDRKLTRLIEQYPSIWCTRHPDYGNFEVTRKQWRTIASHFKRNENIKLRWKNIRKRFVRIERRMREGKRFNGYFDKATNFLTNRDTPVNEWITVDRGEDDGDLYERKQLDEVEQALHLAESKVEKRMMDCRRFLKPVEIKPLDLKIINFVKCNSVLWRKSNDSTNEQIDEETRKSLWMHLWKSMPNKQASDDEDNEIEIVEPKTDTITLDSDNEDDELPSPKAAVQFSAMTSTSSEPAVATNDELDLMSAAQTFLASMLEIDLSEGDQATTDPSPGGSDSTQKKQPRKKTTNKPNPTLLKQKELLERERLEEMKRNDLKLKMKCSIELKKAEVEFPFAKDMLKDRESDSDATVRDVEEGAIEEQETREESLLKCLEDDDEVELLVVADLDSSTDEIKRENTDAKDDHNEISEEKADPTGGDKSSQDEDLIEILIKESASEESAGKQDNNEICEQAVVETKEIKSIEKENSVEERIREEESSVTIKENSDNESDKTVLETSHTDSIQEVNNVPTLTNSSDIDKVENNDMNKKKSVSVEKLNENPSDVNNLAMKEITEMEVDTDEYIAMEVDTGEDIAKEEEGKIAEKHKESKQVGTEESTTVEEADLTAEKQGEGIEAGDKAEHSSDGKTNDVLVSCNIDKETNKLLENNTATTADPVDGVVMNEKAIDISYAAECANGNATTTAPTAASSPGLFNDINEIIEKESNADLNT